MEKKFEKIWELLKEWYDLGLTTTEPKAQELSIAKYGEGWTVQIQEWSAFEDGATIEECLDAHIKELQTDKDYLEAKSKHEVREKGIAELKEAGWI